ncbi:tyrosine-type recombinase/integrase [Dendrosporobacter sp. 1207_IL3150]|uniref:tyrosine-type recombinase/integrase n=1 Tax=Dendrosporobacter sp. 1207_IL3150 TaxID=3084054 RepID=UPI002FD92D6F
MELGQVKKIFFITKKSENVTVRTLETYDEVLKRFIKYLINRNIYDVSEVDSSCVREFFILLQEQGLRGVTRHRYFRSLRTFFLFLHREEYISKNPMIHIKPPKIEQKVMRTFTAQEISKLLNGFDRNTFFGLRNYCITAMFFSTGIRKSELINLTLADINITNDLIRIAQGKGNKERYVPIGRTLRRVMIQYLKSRNEFLKGDNCNYLFVTPRNERKMTGSCLSVLFQKLKKELKLTGEKVSCHTFRHSMAKNYLLNGGDVFSLQKLLGHSDIATTKKYINLNDNELKIQHAKYNPLDNNDWSY